MSRPKLSILIKAYNEEEKIEACVRSALSAAERFDAEVILADSLSTDRTVDIACHQPVKIVQLLHAEDRGCGTGAQLAYQYARGEFIYLMDGDMVLSPSFLDIALKVMDERPELGGVAGTVEEVNVANLTFKSRQSRPPSHMSPGETDRLNMGGLYRRKALEDVGFLSNRNLHAFEEYDLGLRLRSKGWRLMRLPTVSIRHYGHTSATLKLLLQRWRSRYSFGPGELLRAAVKQTYLYDVIWELKALFLVIIWWASLISGVLLLPLTSYPILGALCFGAVLLMMIFIRKRDLTLSLYALLSWNVLAAGLVAGFLRAQVDPCTSIPCRVICEPDLSNSSEYAQGPSLS